MYRTQRFALLALIGLVFAAFSLPAFALDLQQARAGGQLGEGRNGYVSVVKSAPGVQALADEINARRREEYTRISKENGQPVDIVAKLAAEQVIKNLPPGSLYQTESGGWQKR